MATEASSMPRRFLLRRLFPLSLLLLLLLGVVLCLHVVLSLKYRELTTLEVNETYSVRLIAAVRWGKAHVVSCDLLKHGEPLVHGIDNLGLAGESVEGLEFQVLSTPDGKLFGIVEERNPEVLLFVFNTEIVDEPPISHKKRNQAEWLAELRNHYPERDLQLPVGGS